jgi:hypothetical protein
MNHETQGYSLTKKTEGRKSRDTVPLTWASLFCLYCAVCTVHVGMPYWIVIYSTSGPTPCYIPSVRWACPLTISPLYGARLPLLFPLLYAWWSFSTAISPLYCTSGSPAVSQYGPALFCLPWVQWAGPLLSRLYTVGWPVQWVLCCLPCIQYRSAPCCLPCIQ